MIRTKGVSGIYQILNKTTGKKYIGSSVNIKKRWKEHIGSLNQNHHYNKYLQRAWNKYGLNDFKFTVLLYCSRKRLLYHEQIAIDDNESAKNKNGYNLCPTAGNTLGIKLSQEMKDQISQTLKGNIPWNKGLKGVMVAWNKGTKGIMVAWNKGLPMSDEYKQRLSEAHKGQVIPEDQRRKISEALKKVIKERGEHWNKGFEHSEETKQKIASFQKGRVRSEETKRRMSAAKKGHTVSEETKRKISETKMRQKKAVCYENS